MALGISTNKLKNPFGAMPSPNDLLGTKTLPKPTTDPLKPATSPISSVPSTGLNSFAQPTAGWAGGTIPTKEPQIQSGIPTMPFGSGIDKPWIPGNELHINDFPRPGSGPTNPFPTTNDMRNNVDIPVNPLGGPTGLNVLLQDAGVPNVDIAADTKRTPIIIPNTDLMPTNTDIPVPAAPPTNTDIPVSMPNREITIPNTDKPATTTDKPPVTTPGPMDDLNKLLASRLTDLLNGKSPALDAARKNTLNDADRAQRSGIAAAGQRAASSGFAPGSLEYEKLIQDTKDETTSAGTQALADVNQKGFDLQNSALSQAAGFGLGQQQVGLANQRLGLDTLKNTQDQGHRGEVLGGVRTQNEIKNLQSIINDPNSSVGQVDAAKKKLGEVTKLGGSSSWNTPEANPSEMAVKAMADQIRAGNTSLTPEAALAEARKQFATMNKAQQDSLLRLYETDKVSPEDNSWGAYLKSLVKNPFDLSTPLSNPIDPITDLFKTLGIDL